jgi:hypothetical protein
MKMTVFFADLIHKNKRSCFFRADQGSKVNCVPDFSWRAPPKADVSLSLADAVFV